MEQNFGLTNEQLEVLEDSCFNGPTKMADGTFNWEDLDGDVITHIDYDPKTNKWTGSLHDYRKDCTGDIILDEDASNMIEFLEFVAEY